jgi:hypothetical protein
VTVAVAAEESHVSSQPKAEALRFAFPARNLPLAALTVAVQGLDGAVQLTR